MRGASRKRQGVSFALPLACLLGLICAEAAQAAKCVQAEGIAPLRGGEAAAKEEAFARAKWRAMEKVVGVDLQAKTVIQNFRLLDQAIVKQARGVITDASIEQAFRAPDGYHVVARVCVEPKRTDEAIALLQRDTGVVVFIAAKRLHVRQRSEIGGASHLRFRRELEEMNPVAERLIDELVQRHFTVYDAISSAMIDAGALAEAFAQNDLVRVRELLRYVPASFLVFGEIESNIGQMKGSDIGYGLSMPGYRVDVAMRYRLLLRQPDGRMRILGAGSVRDQGIAASPETAYEQALENLAEQAVAELLEKIARQIKGLMRPIRLVVEGVPSMDALFALKDRLQRIPFVERVEESADGRFTIYYPDKTIYLANAIGRIDRLELLSIDAHRIEARYR